MSVVDSFTATPAYTVSGTGPYRIEHAYRAATDLTATVTATDGTVTTLDAADWSVSPALSYTVGDLTLTSAAATTHAGKSLRIARRTPIEQGWAAAATAREQGLSAQLAWLTMAVQDTARAAFAALRGPADVPALTALTANRVLQVNAAGDGYAIGPSTSDISGAAASATAAATSASEAAASATLAQSAAGNPFVLTAETSTTLTFTVNTSAASIVAETATTYTVSY